MPRTTAISFKDQENSGANGGQSAAVTVGAHNRRSEAFEVITALFGAVWLLNGAIAARTWLFAPHGSANLLAAFAGAEAKAPFWLKPVLAGVLGGIKAVGPETIAIVMVTIAALLGFSLLTRRALKGFAAFGVAYSLVLWVVLGALGFPYAGGQTDPGVFIPYAIGFLFVLGLPQRGTPDNRVWDTARLLFGVLWAFDAALKWLPAFLFHFTSQITSVIAGQPLWVADWLHFVASVIVAVGPVFVAVVVALVETAIAISLLANRGLRFMLPFAIAYSLAVWATAEAFGGPFTAAGTGVRGNVIGNAIIYLIPLFYLSAGYYAAAAQSKKREAVLG